ncbi:aldehyde dehydrogenase [Colletotrichum tofieldiae]|nr:aldehyde dehydrogenase [Colletotrichum tofieldiae]
MATNGATKLDWTKFYNIIDGKLETTSKTRYGVNPSTLEANPEFELIEAAKHFKGMSNLPFPKRLWTTTQTAGSSQDTRLWVRGTTPQPRSFEMRLTQNQGVAVGIVPWNSCGKIGPALVTGNAFILKPSPFTPYCDLKLVELAQQFFPPGVFQVLSGDDNLGPWLTSHPGVDKVSFTGSTATGKRVMESCSKTLKRVTLELGGNDAAIVFPDVDVKAVAPKVCIAIKRIYIHEAIYDELVAEMANVVKNLPVGDGQQEGTVLGPVQNQMQFDRVKELLKDIEEQKLKVAAGSTAPASNGKGYFITPTIVDNPPDNSRIVVEEPFGPVFPVLKWSDEKDVIHRANDTLMGLGASVWSKDLEKAQSIAKKLKAGNIWINTHMELQYDAPFGGHKQSGIGYEYGAGGLKAYCNAQSMFITKA